MERNNILIKKEYLKTLFPIMFSILGGTVTSMIDTVMVSLKLGSDGLAAVNLAMPVFLVICSLGVLISGGASIISARKAGNNDVEESRDYYNQAIWISIIAGAVVMILGMAFCAPIADILAQNGPLTQSVKEYIMILFAGAIPYIAAYLPLSYLQIEGKGMAISIMMALTIGVDVVLDWLFLFVIPLRFYGAAAASVLSMLAALLYGLWELQKKESIYRIRRVKLNFAKLKRILISGSPSAAPNFCDALKMIVLNTLILLAGGRDAVAVWAVVNVLAELSRCITAGIPQTAAPMIGVFQISKENSGIRILVSIEMQIGIVMALIYDIILLVLHPVIANLYSISSSLLVPIFCLCIYVIFELVNSCWASEFYATEHEGLSNLSSVLRSVVFPIAIAGILVIYGVWSWLFLPLSALCTLLCMIWITHRIAVKRSGEDHLYSKLLLLDDYLNQSGTLLEYSVKAEEADICEASERIGEIFLENQMERKMINRLELAIEEYLMILKEHDENLKSVDLRVLRVDVSLMIRIRSSGTKYNPFEEPDMEDNIAVAMLKKMASHVQYNYLLGINNVDIMFFESDEGGEQ